MKRCINILLALAMLLSMLPQIPLTAQAADSDQVSRAEWISSLVDAFDMTVEDDNYPDNYYSDITAEDEFYKDIMIAVEFGIIDLDAGLPFRPNDAATREFAAQTLNFSLGFRLDEDATYTFSESQSVTYPDDIQIAINRGWFSLVNGAFLPAQPITGAEKTAMLADVAAILAGDAIDKDYENSVDISDQVIEVPKGTSVGIPEENVVRIKNCPVEIKAGDIFVVYYDELPLAYQAVTVEMADGVTTITCSTDGTDDVLMSLDFEGTIEADLEEFKGTGASTFVADGKVVSVSPTVKEISYDAGKKVLTASKTISLGDGVDATISAKVTNINFDLVAKALKGQYRCVMNGVATLSTNVSVDALEALGVAKTIELGRIYVGGVGTVKLSVEFSLAGEMSLVWTGDLQAGFTYSRSDGLRVVRSFKKKSFTFMAEVTLKSGLRLDAGVDVLVFDANIWTKIGAQMDVKVKLYDTGSPQKCLDMEGFMYASVGVNGSIIKIFDFSKSYDIYTRSNSPIRAHYHYDDGKLVMSCTRGTKAEGNDGTSSDYYTDPSSDQFTPGTSNGDSSYEGSNGETVVIYTYELDEDNNATITGYSGGASALSIPSTIDGYTVTAIGNSAFENNKSLYAVKIPNTVTSVGSNAFDGCTNLSVVTLSKNVTSLGEFAFRNCDALAEIEIPKNLSSGGRLYSTSTSTYAHGAFAGCSGLKTVTFAEGTTKIAAYLFESCDGLEKIVIPDTVTTIGQRAFEDAVNLKQVVFGKAITEIGNYAFSGCEKLEAVELHDSVTAIGAYAFVNCSSMKTLRLSRNLDAMYRKSFGNCTSLTSVEIPKSLTVAGTLISPVGSGDSDYAEGAFYGCSGLKNVTFEPGTTLIAKFLFADCSGIEEIVIPDTVTLINTRAFENASNLRKVTFGKAVAIINSYAFADCDKLEAVEMPDTVTTISQYAFQNCTSMHTLKLSKGLTETFEQTFGNCTALTEVEIPKSLTQAGRLITGSSSNYALGSFYGCSGLKYVTFEEGTTQIPLYIFAKCTGIEEIVIPDTVTVIEKRAFEGATKLKKIVFGGGLTTIQEYAFTESGLTEIVIPDSVTSVGNGILSGCKSLKTATWTAGYPTITSYTFSGCTALTTVNLPDNLSRISTYPFKNCDALVEINIPDSVTWIGQQAFYDCDNLKSVSLGSKLNQIDGSCFYGCDALETITIPNSVTKMGTYVFYSCDQLKNVKLSNALAEIPTYAFAQCAELEEIVIPRNVTKIGTYAFNASPKLTNVVIPASVTSIGSKAFSYADITVIYGVSGSYAETWAANNGFRFVAQDVPATEIALNKTSMNLLIGNKETLQLTVVPENSTDAVTWKSSDTNVATVTTNGIVEAVGAGTATIKVTVGSKSASCKVTVVQPVTSISLNKTSLTLQALQTYQLTATANPSNAVDRTVSWSTSDASIATVDENGLVTAIAKGTATITVTANDGSGVTKKCTVTVTNTGYVVTDPTKMESSHPYASNCSDFWIYTHKDAVSLAVTFDEQTLMEDGFDYLYIYDGSNNQIGMYTGEELAGQTVQVPGDTVKIQISSDDSGSEWGFKVAKIVATEADKIELVPPTLKASNVASTGKIKLTWNKVDGAAKYQVYRATSKNGTYSLLKTTTGTSLTNTSAEAGKTYYYKVRAVDADGNKSEFSDVVNRTCDLPRPEVTVTNVASSGKIKLTWKKVEGAAKYEVYRATSKNGTYSLLKTTTGTSLTNTSAKAGIQYYYKVRAIHSKSSANSAYSEIVTRICDLARPVVKATNVASSGKIKLSWEKVEGATKYEVYRATSKNGTYTKITTVTGTSVTNTKTDAGKTYYYKVKAIHEKSAANSAYSSVVSRTCDLARPTAKVSLNSKGKPVISWGKVEGAVKYTVYIYDANGNLLKTTSTTNLKITHSSAVKGTTYKYQVVAVHSNSAANSAKSAAVSIKSK